MVEPLVVMQMARKDYMAHGMPVAALAPTTGVISPGDRIALRGPSGSGKSTVLNLIAGLDRPTAGTVTWPAFAPALPLPRHAGASFQMASLIPALSALDNVALPLRLMGKTAGVDADARVALSRFGIDMLAERLPSEMSGGQIQRVALARAIVARPRLILADEPTGQLDAATARLTVAALLQAAEDCDAALVVATHDSAVAAAMTINWTMSYGKLTIAIGDLAA